MSSHSPEPWHYHVNVTDDLELCTPTGHVVCFWPNDVYVAPLGADARLIAAAPELLAMLRELEQLTTLTSLDANDDAPHRARALIARIDGNG